jgi:hypothetical protein
LEIWVICCFTICLVKGSGSSGEVKASYTRNKMTSKTTDEIRKLLSNAKLDFDSVENEALNAYLPRIFQSCPFSKDICTMKHCADCAVFKGSENK